MARADEPAEARGDGCSATREVAARRRGGGLAALGAARSGFGGLQVQTGLQDEGRAELVGQRFDRVLFEAIGQGANPGNISSLIGSSYGRIVMVSELKLGVGATAAV